MARGLVSARRRRFFYYWVHTLCECVAFSSRARPIERGRRRARAWKGAQGCAAYVCVRWPARSCPSRGCAWQANQLPPIKWAQRADSLYVTIDVADVKDAAITLDETHLSFRCTDVHCPHAWLGRGGCGRGGAGLPGPCPATRPWRWPPPSFMSLHATLRAWVGVQRRACFARPAGEGVGVGGLVRLPTWRAFACPHRLAPPAGAPRTRAHHPRVMVAAKGVPRLTASALPRGAHPPHSVCDTARKASPAQCRTRPACARACVAATPRLSPMMLLSMQWQQRRQALRVQAGAVCGRGPKELGGSFRFPYRHAHYPTPTQPPRLHRFADPRRGQHLLQWMYQPLCDPHAVGTPPPLSRSRPA
jgi:hypothetical protein